MAIGEKTRHSAAYGGDGAMSQNRGPGSGAALRRERGLFRYTLKRRHGGVVVRLGPPLSRSVRVFVGSHLPHLPWHKIAVRFIREIHIPRKRGDHNRLFQRHAFGDIQPEILPTDAAK